MNSRSKTKTVQSRQRYDNRRRNPRHAYILRMVKSPVPRSVRGIGPFPPSMTRQLTAIFNVSLLAGVAWQVYEFLQNTLYNFNTGGGTTNDFSGTSALAAIYESYHVLWTLFRIKVVSADGTQPCSVGMIAKDREPSTVIASRADAINSLEVAPTTKAHAVGVATGMSMVKIPDFDIDGGVILGNDLTYFSNQGFASSFGGAFDPVQKLWAALIGYSLTGTVPTTGVEVVVEVTTCVKAYGLRPLIA